MEKNFISERNNSQVENAKDLDVLMPMYNLIEFSYIYYKTSGSLWQYYRDEPDDNLRDLNCLNSNQDLQKIMIMMIMWM